MKGPTEGIINSFAIGTRVWDKTQLCVESENPSWGFLSIESISTLNECTMWFLIAIAWNATESEEDIKSS